MDNPLAKRAYSRVQSGPWTRVDTQKRRKGQLLSDKHAVHHMQARPFTHQSHTAWAETTVPGFGHSASTAASERPATYLMSESPLELPRSVPSPTVSMPVPVDEPVVPANPCDSSPRRTYPTETCDLESRTHPLPSSSTSKAVSPVDSIGTLSTGSTSTHDSSPPTPAILHPNTPLIDNKNPFAEFAKRTVQNGLYGIWNDEKKGVLSAYFLSHSFPNMPEREALGRQVGLETSQVSKFFSRTRSEVKYSHTTLNDLAMQASCGLRSANGDQTESPSPIKLDIPDITTAEDKSLAVPGHGRAKGRGRGRGRGRGHGSRGGRGRGAGRPSGRGAQARDSTTATESTTEVPEMDSNAREPIPIAASVQEAALSLMSISCTRLSTFAPISHVTPPRIDRQSLSTKNPARRFDLFSPRLGLHSDNVQRGPHTGSVSGMRPYPLPIRRTVSLFGPDARTLPPPAPTGIHSGSPGLPRIDLHPPTGANSSIGVRESVRTPRHVASA